MFAVSASAQISGTELDRPAQRAESPAGSSGPVAIHGEPQMLYLLDMVKEIERPGRGTPLPVTRERIVRAVLVHPEVAAVNATQRSAQAATREAQAGWLPSIGATVEAANRRADANPRLNVPEYRYGTESVALNLRQLVFDFGATKASVAASREREAAVAARVDNRKADLALRAVQAWLDVYRSRRLLTLALLNVQAREAMVSFLRQRQELGGGPGSDVLRAQSRLAEARAAIAASQARMQSSAAVYRELFGMDPERELDIPALPEFDGATIAAAAADAAREFPAVRSAAAAQRAAEFDRDALQARTLPQVGLEVNVLRRDLVGSGKASNEYNAALVLRYSFYSGGADTARDSQAAERVVEASEQTRGVMLQVERSLAQAIAEDATTRAVLAARRDGVVLAVDSMRAVREHFAARRGSLLDMLTAQETVNAAGVALVDAEVDQVLDRWRVLYFSTALTPLFDAQDGPVR